MEALRDKRAGPEMIFHAQMRLQQRVAGDRNTIQKRQDRVGCNRSRSWKRSSRMQIVAVDSCHDALRPNVHDRLDRARLPGPRSTIVLMAATGNLASIAW